MACLARYLPQLVVRAGPPVGATSKRLLTRMGCDEAGLPDLRRSGGAARSVHRNRRNLVVVPRGSVVVIRRRLVPKVQGRVAHVDGTRAHSHRSYVELRPPTPR